jgi:NADP-dependent 3-hydroxy acid dehydrogenase YdfG
VAGGAAGIGAATAIELAKAASMSQSWIQACRSKDTQTERGYRTSSRRDPGRWRARLPEAGVGHRQRRGPCRDWRSGRLLGRLDAVVNAAGFDRPSDYRAGTSADCAAVLDVHINGHLNLLAHAVPALAASGDGHITGFTSGAG